MFKNSKVYEGLHGSEITRGTEKWWEPRYRFS